MTYDKKLFNELQGQGGGMSAELGDDVTYLVKGLSYISFQMPSGYVLELSDVFFVSSMKEDLLQFLL
jgi:hypothetical protein